MKKQILLFIFIGLAGMINAQTPFTNAQVYDFAVGDVFQTRYYNTITPCYIYETKTILAKTFSAGNDTIFYTVQLDHFRGAPCSLNFSSTTGVDTITDLNGTAQQYNMSTCPGISDTFYVDECGRNIWQENPLYSESCNPSAAHEMTYLTAGYGGPYLLYYSYAFPYMLQWWEKTLVYSNKNGNACGVYTSGLEDLHTAAKKPRLYPNPSSAQLDLPAESNYYFYSITDTQGKVLKEEYTSGNRIDISSLQAGIYMINLYSKDKMVERTHFIKQ